MRRRRRRLRWAVGAVLLAAIAAGVVLAPRLTSGGDTAPSPSPMPSVAEGEQATLLLVRAPAEGAPADTVTLLAAGPPGAGAAIVFLPSGALVDIPGHGLDRLGAAHAYGGAPLAEAAVENALGIAVDHSAVVGDAALGTFLGRVDGLRLDVPQRLVDRAEDGSVALRFAAGPQHLDGPRLAEYWAFRGRDEEELAALPRQQQVWEALLDQLADAAARRRLLAAGAPEVDTDALPAWLRTLFGELADARRDTRIDFTLLPVEPFGGEDDEGGRTYRVREDETGRMVRRLLAASAAEEPDALLRVEVLNGVGTPGIGQRVHERLSGHDFRIVRTDNARSFDFTETQVLVYDEAHLPAARRLRSLLGVGSISLSRRAQSVVDVTVVVGADFLDTEGEST